MRRITAALLLLTATGQVIAATEQEQSIGLCKEALTLGAKQEPRLIDAMAVCDQTDRPAALWECAIKRIQRGETFNYATEQCGREANRG